jgi:hypothetical protein
MELQSSSCYVSFPSLLLRTDISAGATI